MKNVLAILVLLATLTVAAPAQTYTFIPEPSATLIGTFPIHVEIARDGNGVPVSSKTNSTSGGIITVVGTFRTQNGSVHYQIVTPSIHFEGTDGTLIDDVSTPMLYTWLAQAAVTEGTRLGYTPAPNCPATGTPNVFAEACVVRTGSGRTTAFTAAAGVSGQYTAWHFNTCMSSSGGLSAVLQSVTVEADPCAAPAQATWLGQDGNSLPSQIQ